MVRPLLLLALLTLPVINLNASDLWVGEGDLLISISGSSASPIASIGREIRGIARDHIGGGWILAGSQIEHRSSSGALVESYDLGGTGQGIAVSASTDVWVAVPSTGFVLHLVPGSGVVSATYLGGVPYDVAIDRYSRVWVTGSFSNTITRLSSSGSIELEIPVGFFPTAIAAHPDGSLFVAEKEGIRHLDEFGQTLLATTAGIFPIGVTIDRSGGVWFANQNSDDVSHYSPSTGSLETHSVSQKPLGISGLGDGSVAVFCRLGNVVEILDLTGTVVGSISVDYPVGPGDASGLGRSLGADPAGDTDGDGIANLVEAQLGFNPLDQGSTPAVFIRGDCDHDGEIDLADVVTSLQVLFSGSPVTCLEALDINDDQQLDLSDPLLLLGHLSSSGPAPSPPFPAPGFDPFPLGGYPCGS